MTLPQSIREFLEEPNFAVLATLNADGTPQQTILWYYVEGDTLVMNTAAGRVKDRNLRRDPRISVCVVNGAQAVTIRGVAELDDDQSVAQADIRRMAVRYNGPSVAEEQSAGQFMREHRISIRLKMQHVVPQGFD